ncbi:acyl-CoA N-acyltransferase [Russula earlei]|uniref:Acyl-CoA N-acyltransferase n=1 Tax=Russula earlei TaxID=71964 RepID=A0ACC0U2T6_9AGAM|nr:acyl-CoA N-acyltransferase [Russula earlei]
MPFETERTILRPFQPGDSELLLNLYNDPEIQSLAFTDYVAPKLEKWIKEMASSHENSPGFLGLVEDKATRAFVGHVSLTISGAKNRNCSFGIALKREWWGKGIGTEITRWLVNHAFGKLAVHRITLKVLANNDRALAVYKRVGFVEECRVRKYNWDDGKRLDLVSLVILDEEWDVQRGVKVSHKIEAQLLRAEPPL